MGGGALPCKFGWSPQPWKHRTVEIPVLHPPGGAQAGISLLGHLQEHLQRLVVYGKACALLWAPPLGGKVFWLLFPSMPSSPTFLDLERLSS